MLKIASLCVIILLLEKETGENPVRARRREVRLILISLSDAANRRHAIGKFLRRREVDVPSRNIFQAK